MATMREALNRPLPMRRIGGPRWFLPALAAYLLIHLLIRQALSPSLGPDEADLALFSQSLAWGYSEQPPLYAWLVWAFVQTFGLSILALAAVKLLVLGAVHVALLGVARLLLRDRRLPPLASASLFLMPAFAWNAVSYLTHTLLACAVFLATVRCLLLLPNRRHLGGYALLGMWVGLGLLAKYNCAVFFAALFLAALACPLYRPCLADRRILLSLGIAALLALPHCLWVLENRGAVWEVLAFKTGLGRTVNLAGLARGVKGLLLNAVLVLLPLVGGLAVVFRPRPGPIPRSAGAESSGCQLLERFFLVSLLLLGLQAVLGGSRFHERWLQPCLILFPVCCFGRLERRDRTAGRLGLYAAVVAAAALAVTVGQAARIVVGSRDDGTYPLQMSFAGAAHQLADVGFREATLVTSDRVIGGNLRLCFPRARVFCAWHRAYRPPQPGGTRPTFAVWHTNLGAGLPPALAEYAARSLARSVIPKGPPWYAKVPAVLPNRRANWLGYVPLAPRHRDGGRSLQPPAQ